MFVKNLADVLDTTITALSIKHETTTIYTGSISGAPFYLMNEKVIKIELSLGNLFIYI